jgi:hypothetical protein
MEHKERGMTVEMLQSDIAELKANISSCEERISRLPAGDVRKQFEADRADLLAQLAAREKELAGLLGGAQGADSPAIQREMLQKEIADLQANIQTCEQRINGLPEGDMRKFYEKDKADLSGELAQRQRRLSELP